MVAIALLLAGTGCATKAKINWNSRIGTYSYDQAVKEMGPPDKSAKLSDNTLVAEWLTARGFGRTGGYYFWPGHPGTFWMEPPSPDYFIRLTFGPDGKLKEWKKVAR